MTNAFLIAYLQKSDHSSRSRSRAPVHRDVQLAVVYKMTDPRLSLV